MDEVRAVGHEVLVAMTWRSADGSGAAEMGRVFHLVRLREGRIDRMRV